MPDLSNFPALKPARSSDGKHSSVMLEVQGHPFQAVFVCLPTGELSDPVIHGTRADPMTPEQRIELEGEARVIAMQLKEKHAAELLAGMSVVSVDDLLLCVSRAPAHATAGALHRLDDWDVITGSGEFPDPPRSHPTLSAGEWDSAPAWLFWGTLDVQVADGDPSRGHLERGLTQRLGAKHVHVRSLWLDRPEVLAFF